jgi:hypothetical protein
LGNREFVRSAPWVPIRDPGLASRILFPPAMASFCAFLSVFPVVYTVVYAIVFRGGYVGSVRKNDS